MIFAPFSFTESDFSFDDGLNMALKLIIYMRHWVTILKKIHVIEVRGATRPNDLNKVLSDTPIQSN